MSWSAARPTSTALDRLESGMRYRLVLIVAPASSGKSQLLRQWSAWRSSIGQRSPGWISLTDQDNTLSYFLPHLISAVAGIDGEFERWIRPASEPIKLPLLAESQPPRFTASEDYLIALINTLAQAPGEFALIMDEYHRIHAVEIHQTVSFLLEYLPPPVHLYLAARSQPPLRLGRLRARREMIDINQDELSTSY